MIRLRLDTSEVERVFGSKPVRRAITTWVPRAALRTRTALQQEIAARTGTYGRTGYLRNSPTVQLGAGGFSIVVAAKYASFVDQPTRPHEIRPRNKQALAFPSSGGLITRSNSGNVRTRFLYGGRQAIRSAVFSKVVHHPGTKGAFFMEAAEEQAAAFLPAMLEQALREAVEAA